MNKRKILITGGAGFIGINAASYFLKKGDEVIIFDNLSRKGSEKNLEWLKKAYTEKVRIVKGELRDKSNSLIDLLKDIDLVLHLAAQVAVTTSVENPREDFEVNALGTFNLLEAVRKSKNNPVFIYSSTNKVYGGLEDLKIAERKTRYEFESLPYGVSESRRTDFHSPYGCSKGCADQYVRDYARIYGLNTIVFRQSCIYGPHQFGVEDQGWVAWFIIALLMNNKITIYGDGKQVRDLLYVDDLVDAYEKAWERIKVTKGKIYNIGGGRKNSLSVWLEFKPILEELFKRRIDVKFSTWRPGDQPIFVSDIRKAKKDFDWEPKINVEAGIRKLFIWASKNKDIFTI